MVTIRFSELVKDDELTYYSTVPWQKGGSNLSCWYLFFSSILLFFFSIYCVLSEISCCIDCVQFGQYPLLFQLTFDCVHNLHNYYITRVLEPPGTYDNFSKGWGDYICEALDGTQSVLVN